MNLPTVYLIKRVGQGQGAGLINKLKLRFLSPMTHRVEKVGHIMAWLPLLLVWWGGLLLLVLPGKDYFGGKKSPFLSASMRKHKILSPALCPFHSSSLPSDFAKDNCRQRVGSRNLSPSGHLNFSNHTCSPRPGDLWDSSQPLLSPCCGPDAQLWMPWLHPGEGAAPEAHQLLFLP